MTFSLIVLGDGLARSQTLFHLTALTVFCSILVHGVTDHAGAEWLAARAERRDEARQSGASAVTQ